ncbi:MAG: LamG domain-containing protein [Luteolibacter sp.]
MKKHLIAASASILAFFMPLAIHAQVTEVHLFPLGEDGTFINDLVQDTVGSAHFTDGNGLGIGTVDPSPISAKYAVFNGVNDFQFAADFSSTPVDNFAAELWVRVPAVNQTAGLLATGKKDDGNLRFHLENGYWAASYKGIGWIGANLGVAPSQIATANVWTHLAVIRSEGVSTFYINGVAQAGTVAGTPFHGANGHLAVFSGGIQSLGGNLDHIRIFSFNPLTDNPVAALTINQLPPAAEIRLNIEIRQPDSRVILTWPAAAGTSAFPQRSSDLRSPWTTITAPASLLQGLYEIDLGPAGTAEFFRLAIP